MIKVTLPSNSIPTSNPQIWSIHKGKHGILYFAQPIADVPISSHNITHTFPKWMVQRICILILGVEGLNISPSIVTDMLLLRPYCSPPLLTYLVQNGWKLLIQLSLSGFWKAYQIFLFIWMFHCLAVFSHYTSNQSLYSIFLFFFILFLFIYFDVGVVW